MFQVAATLSLAKDNNTEASFPNLEEHLINLNIDNFHNPKLNHANEYKNLNIFKFLKQDKPIANTKIYNFPFHYEKINLNSEHLIIDGYFQSEKYFIKNEQYIREKFSIDDFIIDYINKKYNNVLQQTTTSIHVRRGDYLKLNQYHPTMNLDYFKNGIDLTKLKTKNYIVFSDDIEWCKTKFLGNRFIFIENEKDYIEMYLMSLCDNNIISNSTFSWWSSWLNPNESKTVISPKKWFGKMIEHSDSDIIPSKWLRI
jgi:hypothetical protein